MRYVHYLQASMSYIMYCLAICSVTGSKRTGKRKCLRSRLIHSTITKGWFLVGKKLHTYALKVQISFSEWSYWQHRCRDYGLVLISRQRCYTYCMLLDSLMGCRFELAAYYTSLAGLHYRVSASKDGLEVYFPISPRLCCYNTFQTS